MASDKVSQNVSDFANNRLPQMLFDAMADACALVQGMARQKCPKDTGTLRRSIDFDVSKEGSDKVEGTVYSNMEYAPYVEIGTGIHSSKGSGRQTPWRYEGRDGWVTTSGNEPQPFLEPAALESQGEIAKSFEGLF